MGDIVRSPSNETAKVIVRTIDLDIAKEPAAPAFYSGRFANIGVSQLQTLLMFVSFRSLD